MSNLEMRDFLPYLLTMAAEEVSVGFQRVYRERYGMLRTDWRVLFHLGRYGAMTASEVRGRSRLHKTKVSRAVANLERLRMLSREADERDRRRETLSLTPAGMRAYDDLAREAERYDAKLWHGVTPQERDAITAHLRRLADLA
ncbi:homoprotocatechuate degradation operon regulator, HpaR [Jannaschia seosinensis]|uniref:Homoprotocatechuate degradation operon regulator, HpaR n=1 Tax=Jannaschia seosinensis TaxID=313367 RepID=A0A0M7BDH6_9RHOB|nr:MarR family winged helix-turn-helix transcriptional regulator [Jannaschia seosinensis]CUH40451.1 homoprotocatechuate degradation operon regulator, HpaR [Jannaschia seosinensis]